MDEHDDPNKLPLPQNWPALAKRAILHAVSMASTSLQVRSFLGRAFGLAGQVPKYVVCDKGKQFWCDAFKKWAKRRGMKPRYGAVGKCGSIAVIERFIRSLKDECTRRILVPMQFMKMRREVGIYFYRLNSHRTSQSLNGRTPDEFYS